MMRISVITPTFERETFLPGLYEGFARQTYPDLELLIADDSAQPSAFASQLKDERVKYFRFPKRQTIGEKRNFLIEQASGPVIAFFDDDDYYAPTYLETMAENLGSADMITLSAWFTLQVATNELFYWDTRQISAFHLRVGQGPVAPVGIPRDEKFIAANLNGYGFSYLFRKSVHASVPFPPLDYGEDYSFATGVLAAGYNVNYLDDRSGLVLHLLHGQNTSLTFPQFQLPGFLASTLFPGFTNYLKLIGRA